jgi:hypothetical protein
MTALACLLVALGLWLAYRQKSRELFDSFGAKVRAKTLGAASWLTVTALISTGVVILAVQYESTWGWLVLLPLYGFLLYGMWT